MERDTEDEKRRRRATLLSPPDDRCPEHGYTLNAFGRCTACDEDEAEDVVGFFERFQR